YTATVYEKGAEVIRVLKILLGPTIFKQGMDLYLSRHDGDAATIEDFVACFAEVSGRDLSQFFLWYRQSGTPDIAVEVRHDARAGTVTLDVTQTLYPTPGQPSKQPMVIPIAFGLVGEDGRDRPLLSEDGQLSSGILEINALKHRFVFSGHPTRPIASLNRGFSAPVKISANLSDQDLLFLAGHDNDPYNRWQSAQTVATRLLTQSTRRVRDGLPPLEDPALIAALSAVLKEADSDPAFAALVMTLPTEADIAREIATDVDPDAIFVARSALRRAIGQSLAGELQAIRDRLVPAQPFSPDAVSAGRRALRNVALDLIAAPGAPSALDLAEAQFEAADNMTDRLAALSVLAQHAGERRERALEAFRARYHDDPLVIDKWYALQATIAEDGTLARVETLITSAGAAMANPNRLRSLVGAFATGNPTQFNRADGAGYTFLADIVLKTDATNSQVAARLLSAFRSWRALEPVRREKARLALSRVASANNLSPDVRDIVDRSLL
ncbi:MAG: DUF3458 domain-containing protein, partial [Alphaproteobacteria bacterium]